MTKALSSGPGAAPPNENAKPRGHAPARPDGSPITTLVLAACFTNGVVDAFAPLGVRQINMPHNSYRTWQRLRALHLVS